MSEDLPGFDEFRRDPDEPLWIEQRGLDGDTAEGQTTLDGGVVRDAEGDR